MNSEDGVENLINSTQKAREYAYLGMYEESVYHYRKSINGIKTKISRLSKDPKLRFEYELLLDEVTREFDYCDNFDSSIKTGGSKKMTNEPSKISNYKKTSKNNDNGEEDNGLPFGKTPFQHHKPTQNVNQIQETPKKKVSKQKSDVTHEIYVPQRKPFNMSQTLTQPEQNHNFNGLTQSAHYIDYSYNQQNIPPHGYQNNNNSYENMYQHIPEYNNSNIYKFPNSDQYNQQNQFQYEDPSKNWMNNPYPQQNELPKKKKSALNNFGNNKMPWRGNCGQDVSVDKNLSPLNQKKEKKQTPKLSKSIATMSTVNVSSLEKKRSNYEKPWLSGLEPKNGSNKKKDRSNFLYHVYPDGIGPDDELIKMLEKEVIERSPGVTFEDIAELDRAKEILFETVIYPLLMPKFYQGIRKPRKGVLLFGPPGTGKTMLAKALATTSDTMFFNVSPSTLASKWKGDSEKLVR